MLSPNGLTQATGLAGNLLNVGNSSSLKVALVAADEPSFVLDVQAKLQATGRFSQIDLIDASSTTPTLAQLQAYDAVLVWNDLVFADADTLGNNLADYIDGGGGVVVAPFANTNGPAIRAPVAGRFLSDDYYAIEPFQTRQGEVTLGTVYEPASPLMAEVSSLDGGTSSYRSSGSPNANAIRVADWSSGDPLVASRVVNGTPRADINLFPPSKDAESDLWLTSTDGATLMANALEFVHPSCTPAQAGMSHWWAGDGNANDSIGRNDGTLQGGATFGAGEVRQAFSFPGNSGDAVNLGFVSLPSTKFSFAAWVNGITASPDETVWSNLDGFNGFLVVVESGDILVSVFSGGAITQYDTTTFNITPNEWHHIGITFDGTAPSGQRLVIYVDGAAQPVEVPLDDATSVGSSSVPALIGSVFGGGFPWVGAIDEVQLFAGVLTPEEVAGIANAGHAGVCRSFQISASASPSTEGTVTGAGMYDFGAQATLKAKAKAGFQFVNWTEGGTQVSASATYTFTVSRDRTLVANFQSSSHLGTANGSGTILTHNNQASFSFNISDDNTEGTPSGMLSYTDTKGGIKLTSTAITAITLDQNQATFSGKGTIPGSKPNKPIAVSFTVIATDNGTPGAPKDTFEIEISSPYFANGNLTSGNIVVH